MSKLETRKEIKAAKTIAAWQPRLETVAGLANVKPGLVRLAAVTLEGGVTDIQICVSGRGDSDTKHNHKAVARAVRSMVEGPLPAIHVKRCSSSCTHIAATQKGPL